MNIDLTELFKLGGFNPLEINDFTDSEEAAYLKGVNLAKPIKLEASNGLKADVYSDSSYSEFNTNKGVVDGQLKDQVSGKTISFTDAESFAKAQRELEKLRQEKLDEELEEKLHNKIVAAQMLMISSAGGPEQTESQYNSAIDSLKNFAGIIGNIAGLDIRKIAKEKESFEPEKNRFQLFLESVDSAIAGFDERKKDAVVDAVRSNISFMSLAELMQFASRFPGLDSVIKSRLALIKKAGLDTNSAQMKSGQELSDLVSEHKRSAVVQNLRERSDSLDFGKVKLSPNEQSVKDIRNKLDWYPTIDIA